jgi:hypothetical protein
MNRQATAAGSSQPMIRPWGFGSVSGSPSLPSGPLFMGICPWDY